MLAWLSGGTLDFCLGAAEPGRRARLDDSIDLYKCTPRSVVRMLRRFLHG